MKINIRCCLRYLVQYFEKIGAFFLPICKTADNNKRFLHIALNTLFQNDDKSDRY